MPRRALALALSVAFLAGCGSSSSPKATPSPTPSPTPTLPPVAEDTANLKKALVTAADIGKPWVTPKSVNKTATKKGDYCPGHKDDFSRVATRADVDVSMTEGTKTGADIASFEVVTYDPAKLDAWRAGFAATITDCAAFTSPEKLWVTTEAMPAVPAVEGCDEVLGRTQHIYADKTKKTLYYVRQDLRCRIGRVVIAFELAFIQPKSDPTGADTTKSVSLVSKQVAKVRSTFPA
jgi:hypothetical protein